MRFRTLRQIDEAGHDIRIWCFRCARSKEIDGAIWFAFSERGWPIELDLAATRFTCRRCRRCDQVLIVPASREPQLEFSRQVVKYFHDQRALRKALRRVK